jgi:hypothetical protein
MESQSDESAMSHGVREVLNKRLPTSLARKAKEGLLAVDELEQLLYDAGSDMAEVQAVIDEYLRLFGG